jgi:hypothetical protein
MHFKFKSSTQKRNEEFIKLSQWHKWFCFLPVITDTEFYWLCTIERKLDCIGIITNNYYFVYRKINDNSTSL